MNALDQSKVNRKLCESAGRGDLETITKFLNEGAQVNSLEQPEITDEQFEDAKAREDKEFYRFMNGFFAPLHRAVMASQAEAVELLLDCGANPNAPDETPQPPWDLTPLMIGARCGYSTIIEILLEAGADPMKRDESCRELDLGGMTALHFAAEKGHSEVVKILCRKMPRIDIRCTDGDTPLSLAVTAESVESVAALIRSGASPNPRKPPLGITPLHQAVRAGNIPIVSLLLQAGAMLETKDSLGDFPIHEAIRKDDVELFNLLRTAGASLPQNALKIALKRNADKIVRLLRSENRTV